MIHHRMMRNCFTWLKSKSVLIAYDYPVCSNFLPRILDIICWLPSNFKATKNRTCKEILDLRGCKNDHRWKVGANNRLVWDQTESYVQDYSKEYKVAKAWIIHNCWQEIKLHFPSLCRKLNVHKKPTIKNICSAEKRYYMTSSLLSSDVQTKVILYACILFLVKYLVLTVYLKA